MANSAEVWVIIGVEGKPIADIYGNVAVFTSKDEAASWAMFGERVERSAHDGSPGKLDQ